MIDFYLPYTLINYSRFKAVLMPGHFYFLALQTFLREQQMNGASVYDQLA